MSEKVDPQEFETEIERLRAAQALGRSAPLARLFDYLAERALKGQHVSEIDIAVDVFGKSGADPGDASVRVYIHRLRKKLDDHYAAPNLPGDRRLVIPRGEYRLALADREALEAAAFSPPARRPGWLLPLSAAILVLAGAFAGQLAVRWLERDPVTEAAGAPIWADLAAKPKPVVVVIGDYYIFGESEDGEVRRLVREFDVNSTLDLETWLLKHPEQVGRSVDLNLNYVPLGAAMALSSVLPLARQVARGGEVRLVTASELSPDMLRGRHIIYVGYLSGLGALENTVFTRSNFGIGLSYDEILDYRSRRVYISEAGQPGANRVHKDYGYISTFRGPSGDRIVVVAGTRDIGVMQAAEVAADPAALRALSREVEGARSLEGVYEVEGLGRQNLMGRLILSAPRQDLDTPEPRD